VTLPLVAAIALYVAAVAVDVAPPSPAQIRLLPVASRVVIPYFTQIWTLFAPTPPESQRLAYVEARYRLPGDTAVRTTAPLNISQPPIDYARSRRWAPSKLMSVPLYFEEVLYPTPQQMAKLARSRLSSQVKEKVLGSYHREYQPIQQQLTRYLSVEAEAELPADAHILAVRGEFVSVPMTAFSERYSRHPPVRRGVIIYDSHWRTYIPGVAS
jgi:hypothetical protein